MDERLAARIERARRNLRISRGIGSSEDLQSVSQEKAMEQFRQAINEVVDLTTTVLLGFRFQWHMDKPVARLEVDQIESLLCSNDGVFTLRDETGRNVIVTVDPKDSLATDRLLCAIGDYINLVRREPASSASS